MFRVTVVANVGNQNARLITNDGENIELVEGTVVGLNEIILSNESYVEVRTNFGYVFRLSQHSEMSVESTITGVTPVIYGDVWKGYIGGNESPITMCGKYRTSCYVRCVSSFYSEKIDDQSDAFYILSDNFEIFEYDERGKKFPIVNGREGQKVILRYNNKNKMKNRYEVSSIEEITDSDYDYITDTFLNPKSWQ